MTTALPPNAPTPNAMRVSTAEREPVLDRLQRAYADGMLDKTEFDQRLHQAMTAKTHAELGVVVADLPEAVPSPRVASSVPQVRADPSAEERILAALAHASGVVTLFVGPLVMLCTVGRRSPYVRSHIASALNFQLTLLIVTFGIGGIVYAVAWIVAAVAALCALAGSPFRYPFTFRIAR